MPKKGWRTVTVREERLSGLDALYQQDKKRPKNQEFGGWFDNLLLQYVEFHEQLKEYGPFLEFKDTSENMIHLYDHRTHRSIDIHIHGKKRELQCQDDHTTDCVHIGFCFAIPEVYKVLIEAGFKEPKRTSRFAP
jgi:hypothetical protein